TGAVLDSADDDVSVIGAEGEVNAVALPGPLTGIQVVDLSERVGGSYCTKLFADYGADVITVAAPGEGSPIRREGPFADPAQRHETGALHLYLNTNKRSLTLDPGHPTGQDILSRLLERADALVVDRPASWLEELGFPASVREQSFP